ncbi:MAG: HAD family hydrolase [Methanobacteriota archaeon]
MPNPWRPWKLPYRCRRISSGGRGGHWTVWWKSGEGIELVVKAVFFDVGQTLIDSRRENDEAFVSVLNELGATIPPGASFASAILQAHKEFAAKGIFAHQFPKDEGMEFWVPFDRRVIELAGVKGDLDRYSLEAHLRWFDHVGIYAYRDTVPAVEALRGMGLRLGIISNGLEGEIFDVLARAKIDAALFDPVVGSDTFSCEKPSARVFEETARRAGLKPGECAFVGDRLDKDGGAAKAGMRFFWMDRKGKGGAPEWAERIGSLAELHGLLAKPRP